MEREMMPDTAIEAIEVLKRLGFGIVGSMFVALVFLSLINAVETNAVIKKQKQEDQIVRDLDAEPFSAYMEYFAIVPRKKTVNHGDLAWFMSDSVVHKGSFRIKWEEYIMCDISPDLDDTEYQPKYKYYKRATTTSVKHEQARPRKGLEDNDGFPVRSHETGEIIRYPEVDAICILVSEMTQIHRFGITKEYTRRSEPVYVVGDDA